jgi:hypothetical protein
MHVVRGVFRRSDGLVSSGFVSQRAAQRASDDTSDRLFLRIQSNAASENLLKSFAPDRS